MSFEKDKLGGILLRILAIISCIIALFVFAACKKSEENIESKKEEKVSASKTYLKAVFERNDNIYFYSEESEALQPIGETTKFKELMTLSPDKKNIAFKYFYEEHRKSTEVIIYNLEDRSYKTISIEDNEMENIVELKWINVDEILIAASINPSVLKYEVYNIKSLEQVAVVEGLLMEVAEDGNFLYSKPNRKEGSCNLYLGDKLIYETTNLSEEIHFATISTDKTQIAFRTISYGVSNGEIKEFLYIGQLDNDNLTVKNLKKIDMPSNILGDLKFDKNNNLYIKGEERAYKLQDSTFTEINGLEENNSYPTREQLIKFKTVLKDTFIDDFIEENLELEELDIYNIQWF